MDDTLPQFVTRWWANCVAWLSGGQKVFPCRHLGRGSNGRSDNRNCMGGVRMTTTGGEVGMFSFPFYCIGANNDIVSRYSIYRTIRCSLSISRDVSRCTSMLLSVMPILPIYREGLATACGVVTICLRTPRRTRKRS